MHIFADYHTHTHYSHGKGTVEQNVAAAMGKGLSEIAISDHGPAHMFGIGIKDYTILDKIRREAASAMEKYPQIKVLVGIEANVTSVQGDIDLPADYLSKVDILQVGLHVMVRPENWGEGIYRYGLHYFRWLAKSIRDRSRIVNTEAIVNAVHKNPIDVITHPGHRLDIDTRALAKACAKRNTAFEINTSHSHITGEYLQIAAAEGVEFVIGSDAHHPSRVGDFAKGIELAKSAGITAAQIRNAREENTDE